MNLLTTLARIRTHNPCAHGAVLEVYPLPPGYRALVMDAEHPLIGIVLHGGEGAWECKP